MWSSRPIPLVFVLVACAGEPGDGDDPTGAADASGASTATSTAADASASASATAAASTSADVTTDGGSSGPGTDDSSGGTGGPFEPNPLFADLADETVIDLGPFACEPVPGEEPTLCIRTTDYSGMVYDPHRHQMLAFGGGHSTTMTDAIHAFDLATATWSDLYPPTACDAMTAANLDADAGAWTMGRGPYPRPVSTHTYDMLAVSPMIDEFLVISRNFSGGYCNAVGNDIGGKIAHFDRAGGSWSFSPMAQGASYDLGVNLPGSEPDPVSGRIVLFGGGGLASYDPATRVYTQHVDTYAGDNGNLGSLDGIGYANHLVYFPPDDRFYLFAHGSQSVWALAYDRDAPAQSVAERLDTSGPSPGDELGFDYDARNHVIGGGVRDGVFYAFDPFDATWSSHVIQGGNPGTLAFHALAYDAVDNVYVFIASPDSGAHTWAFRLAN
ncbi:MAG: hypothetical protein IPK74_36710 [Deltaproteobacteria bacterium]|nr:hypothetical protein [Deltaproteobacteria bacterium]